MPILHYPDPRLHKAWPRPSTRVDDSIRKLINDMAETMYAAPGIGLAATQVDVHERVIVIDISDDTRIFTYSSTRRSSKPSGEAELRRRLPLRAGRLRQSARAPSASRSAPSMPEGEPFELEAEGLLAVCIQHEIDHLEGKVFVDYLSRLKQSRIAAKLRKQ